jgi:hypothetical protein
LLYTDETPASNILSLRSKNENGYKRMPTSSQRPMQFNRPSIVSRQSKYMNKFNIFRASIKKPSDMDKSYQDVDDLSSVGDETAIDDFAFRNATMNSFMMDHSL